MKVANNLQTTPTWNIAWIHFSVTKITSSVLHSIYWRQNPALTLLRNDMKFSDTNEETKTKLGALRHHISTSTKGSSISTIKHPFENFIANLFFFSIVDFLVEHTYLKQSKNDCHTQLTRLAKNSNRQHLDTSRPVSRSPPWCFVWLSTLEAPKYFNTMRSNNQFKQRFSIFHFSFQKPVLMCIRLLLLKGCT